MKKIVDVNPILSQVLVEFIKPSELSGTTIIQVAEKDDVSNQAYVLKLGSGIKSEEVGIKVGDRVVLQHQYIPMPEFGNHRQKAIVEIYSIKGVLVEGDEDIPTHNMAITPVTKSKKIITG